MKKNIVLIINIVVVLLIITLAPMPPMAKLIASLGVSFVFFFINKIVKELRGNKRR